MMNKPYIVDKSGKIQCKDCNTLLQVVRFEGRGKRRKSLLACPKCNPEKFEEPPRLPYTIKKGHKRFR